jgi:hypothetical protein
MAWRLLNTPPRPVGDEAKGTSMEEVMIRPFISTLIALSLCSATALAEESIATSAAANAPPARAESPAIMQPGAGRVPLRIEVTQARRVFVRQSTLAAAAGGTSTSSNLQYVCTTPCRLYVQPGPVDVVLVGWASTAYHWDVPSHGGSVHLLARLPNGQLSPMPTTGASPSAVARATAASPVATPRAPAVAGTVAAKPIVRAASTRH